MLTLELGIQKYKQKETQLLHEYTAAPCWLSAGTEGRRGVRRDQLLVFTYSFSLVVGGWTLGLAAGQDQRCLLLRGDLRRACQSRQVLGEVPARVCQEPGQGLRTQFVNVSSGAFVRRWCSCLRKS